MPARRHRPIPEPVLPEAELPDPPAPEPLSLAGMFESPAYDQSPPQIKRCHNCELPLSTKARYCRRCGSAQG